MPSKYWKMKYIPEELRPPGYPPDHCFTPIVINTEGENKFKCPITGCNHSKLFKIYKNKNSTGYRKHLNKTSHAYCVDVSVVKLFGNPGERLVYDIRHRVLVCTPTQNIIYRDEFNDHRTNCKYCSDIESSSLSAVIANLNPTLIETYYPIQGLDRFDGIQCDICNTVMIPLSWKKHRDFQEGIDLAPVKFQRVRGVIRCFDSEVSPQAPLVVEPLNEADFKHHEAPLLGKSLNEIEFNYHQAPEDFLNLIQPYFEDFTLKERMEFIGRYRSEAEEMVVMLAKVYFLESYIPLANPAFMEFREKFREIPR